MKTISLSTNLKQTDMEKQTIKTAVNDIHKQTANSLSDYYTAISVIAGDFLTSSMRHPAHPSPIPARSNRGLIALCCSVRKSVLV